MVVVNSTQSGGISGINIMQVDTAATLAYLRIGRGPLACLSQILLKRFLPLLVRNIKVDDDVVLGELDIV